LVMLAVIAAAGVLGVRRMRAPWIVVAATAGGVCALYVIGYLAFRYADLRIAVGSPSLALVLAGLAGLIRERREALGALDELRRQLARRLRLAASARPGIDEAEILDRF